LNQFDGNNRSQIFSDTYHLPDTTAGVSKSSPPAAAPPPWRHIRRFPMPYTCPRCESGRIETKHHGRKVGGAVGVIAGSASGVAAATAGAEAGAVIGAVGGPVGIALGGFAGAILGGLAGGVAGGTAGATVGEQLDGVVINNCLCLACGHSFATKQT
jgi:hypothetical protein